MTSVADAVDRSPLAAGELLGALRSCVEACRACVDACLAEREVERLRDCIRTDLDTIAVCDAALDVLGRPTGLDVALAQSLLQVGVAATRASMVVCGAHRDHHDHCAHCADAAERAERAAVDALRELVTTGEPVEADDSGGGPEGGSGVHLTGEARAAQNRAEDPPA
jgi:hypothetical protein